MLLCLSSFYLKRTKILNVAEESPPSPWADRRRGRVAPVLERVSRSDEKYLQGPGLLAKAS